jgi:Zn-dependent peptidase ImmA (M78 family)
MATDPLSRTEKEARRLLERLVITTSPVDVESIAKKLGLQIRYERFKPDLSGVLVKSADKATIGINSSHPRVRQRFSIAHEIAHFWLNHPGDMFIDEAKGQASVVFRDGRSGDGTNLQEMEANRFAAAILMPFDFLFESYVACAERHGADERKLLADLASEYEVSTQAMKIRLSSLGLWLTL